MRPERASGSVLDGGAPRYPIPIARPSSTGSDDPPDDSAELSVRAISTVVLYFEKVYGSERLKEVWAQAGLSLSLDYVHDLTNYVSLRFAERAIQAVAEASGDPQFMMKAGMMTVTPEAIGFAFNAVRAFGSPRLAYERTLQVIPMLNRVGSFTLESVTNNSMVLSYRTRVPERTKYLCQGRQAQFACFPLIWGLEPAEVQESQCQLEGADSCRYHLRWQNPLRSWRRYAGLLIGLLAGVAFASWLGGTLALLLPVWGIAGFLGGGWMDSRADKANQDERLGSQEQALNASFADLQRRHEDLLQANRELESRVHERTQELEAALEVQRDLDRQKTEFFDNVSHELRTPLTIILLSLESLLMRDASQVPLAIREHLMAMDRSATKLIRLINNLLDLAKMEAGKKRLAYQPVEMQSFLRSLLSPFKVVAEEKRIALELEGSASTPILVDPEMMDVVFQNLIANALKFTVKGRVAARLSETETHVVAEVIDTGHGMAKEDLPLIFNRFAQADSTGIRRFGGTGIGLALVKETVELHGGQIDVSSEVGVGSVFRVMLPKGEAHLREDLRERRQTEVPVRKNRRGGSVLYESMGRRPQPSDILETDAQALASAEAAHTPRTNKRVVVVEDDAEIRKYIMGMLHDDYRLSEAKDGEEGLALIQKVHPDLVITDVMMPNMSGFQLVAALRKLPAMVDVPVIVLTARNELESKVTGFESGANDYVTKPFTPRELVARVEAQLRIREAAVRGAENEKLATMGLLTSGFAHEVRNPLNGLLNALGPLQDQMGNVRDAESTGILIGIVKECGERIRHLAESLLSFARTNAKELVDIPSSIDATLNICRWRFPNGIETEVVYKCEDKLWADRGGLNIVWLNLIDNAVRAMPEGGKVVITTERKGSEIEVSFRDSGVGIAEEVLPYIFEPFFSTRSSGDGTGLGLSLCRRIVLQHGGRIQVTSQPRQGSSFSVFLPLLDARTVTVDDAGNLSSQPAALTP